MTKNLRVFVLALPLTMLLGGCPIYVDDGSGPTPPECTDDVDCDLGDFCRRGVCTETPPECTTHTDCAGDEVCTGGACVPGSRCTDDEECAAGEICEAGACRSGDRACRTHGDCEVGRYCEAGSCAPSGTCSDDSECTDSGFWCDFRDTCVPQGEAQCRTGADCSATEVCVEGRCRETTDTCQFDRQCPPGNVCLNNACTRICTGDTDCVGGESCQGGFCRPNGSECSNTAACPSGENCVDGRCLDDCATTMMCDTGEYCGEDDFCRSDWKPEPFCTRDGQCGPARVCRTGVCRTPCPTTENEECMRFDSQVPECRMEGTEHLCHATNEIMPECRVGSDCTDTEDCVDGACRNRR